MKKVGLGLLLLTMSISAFSQGFKIDYLKNSDGSISRGRLEDGKKTGLWSTYDQQGNPKRYEEYKNGVKHGYFVENDEHGHPFMEGWFNEGIPVGKHTVFSHGTLLKVMDFDSSIVREYYESSTLKKVGHIRNGELDGKQTQYYETGGILSENTYVAGKKTGVQKYFYQNGKLQAEYVTVDNVLSGAYKDFHENGTLATEGMYEKNLKQGLWKEYDTSGKPVKQVKYKNDVEVK